MRSWLGGSDNSFLKVFGGEFEFDNFNVKLHETRGNDNGVRISYGKNLTDLNADIDIQNTYTTIYAFAVDGNGQYHETTIPS
jgi:Phage-related protein